MRQKLPKMLNQRYFIPGYALAVLLVVLPASARSRPRVAVNAISINTINRLTVQEEGSRTVLRVRGSRRPMFSVFKLQRPPRLTIDIANCRLVGVSNLIDVGSWAVSQVATSQFRTNSSAIARVMVNFRRPSHYHVAIKGHDLVVTISPHRARPPDKSLAATKRARRQVEAHKRAAAKARTEAARANKLLAQYRAEADQARAAAREQAQQVDLLRQQSEHAKNSLQKEAAQNSEASRAARRQLDRTLRQLARAEQQAKQSARARQKLEARLAAAKERASAAERSRVRADRAREIAEQHRRQADRARKAAENKRQAAEQHWRKADLARKAAETQRRAAETQRRQADLARKAAETQRRAAETQRRQADRAREEAEKQRRAAEQARREADKRAKALRRAVSKVKAQQQRLATAAREVERLQKALRRSQQREQEQRRQVLQAQRRLAKVDTTVSDSARRREALARVVDDSRKKQKRLLDRLTKLDSELKRQQAETERATKLASRMRNEAEKARQRLAAQKERRAREEAAKQLAVARRRADDAARVRRQALQHRSLLASRLAQARRDLASLGKELHQRRAELAKIARQVPKINAKVKRARAQLAEEQRQLARLVAARKAEQQQQQKAEQRRQRSEQRLAVVKGDRAHAERLRVEALKELESTRDALRDARQRKTAARRSLAAIEKELATARKSWTERRQQQQAELSRRQRELAKLAASLKEKREEIKRVDRQAKAGRTTGRRRAQAKHTATTTRIKDLRFVDRRTKVRVEVDVDGSVDHELYNDAQSPVLAIRGTSLPRKLQRTLDTSAFDGPVGRVSSFLANRKAGTVHIKVALKQDAAQRVRREGNTLVWEFDKPIVAVAAKARRPASRFGADSKSVRARTYDYGAVKVAAGRSKVRMKRRKKYSGRRIDLDFKDADIHNILRLLSDVGNVNIITSDAVSGRVTIRMKNVPWDHALDVILRAKGFGMVQEGNLLRVAPMGDLEKEREAELARQKQVVLLQPLETRLIPLSYAQAGQVLPKLQYTLSPRGKLTYDARTNTIIARDIRSNLNLVQQMIRNLDTQTPQVLIEARIVEARTNYSKQLGIQWGGSFTATAANGNSTGLVFPNEIGIGGGTDDPAAPTGGILLGMDANPNFLVNMPASTGLNSGAAIGLALGSLSGAFNVALRLSAAEATGDIRIISSPRITTLDNVQATISQGVTIPFAQVSANGVQTTFKDARLDLSVNPHVTADGSVIMKITVNRNEPDFVNTGPRGDPTILTKTATTEMLVKDGMTAVIGGIYTTRDGRSWNKVPWLAEIPILGWFFKNRRETSDREEVLVFITPRIINRAESIGG